MNRSERHIKQELPESDALFNPTAESFDFQKLKTVLLKSWLVIILIILTTITISTFAVRYTRELFQSSSVLQLDIKSEAKVLGFKSFDDDITDLAREIEIIKSNLFFSKVVETLKFHVSYYQYGDLLFEERYKNAPFKIDYVIFNSAFYDKNIDLEILDKDEFILHYQIGDYSYNQKHRFNDSIVTKDFKFYATLNGYYDPSIDNRYFFRINSNAALINYLNSNINVAPLDFKARTISISFKDHDRFKARDIVHTVDTLYLYYTQMEKNKANMQKISFLDQQLKQTEEKLTELENYFENFTISNKTTNPDENLGKTIVMLEALDSQRFETQQKIKIFNTIYDQLISEENFTVNPSFSLYFPSDLKQGLSRLETLIQEKDILLSSYKKSTFAYQKKEQEIRILKSHLIEYLESAKQNLHQKLNSLKEQKSSLEKQFIELPEKRTEYGKTERYYNLYEEFYLSLIKNKAEFQLAQAGTVTDFKILSPASLPAIPISPNKWLFYGVGIIAGIFISIFLVGIRYLLHNKINNVHELENLTHAFVLGTIPSFNGYNTKEESSLVVDKRPKSEISEAFRSIRTNLEFLNGIEGTTVLAITSTVSGEGKTYISVNLGGIISLLKNKVVILDLDMRKPITHKEFYGGETDKGLSTILINKHSVEECVHSTSLENLDYIPSGPIPPNPSELIDSKNFDDLISNLKKKYDVIILDTPPVGLVTDGIIAMKKSNIPIYIVRADFSNKSFVRSIDRTIKLHKLNNLSIILNSTKSELRNKKEYARGYYDDNIYFESYDNEKKESSLIGRLKNKLQNIL